MSFLQQKMHVLKKIYFKSGFVSGIFCFIQLTPSNANHLCLTTMFGIVASVLEVVCKNETNATIPNTILGQAVRRGNDTTHNTL